jgi:threonine synthase
MTSVLDENVFNIAIKGTFDDGQEIVKGVFNDIEFKNRYHLGAVNSINWARVLAQVVYYVYAYFRVCRSADATVVDYAIPTGNFGDIFAGFVARKILGAGRIGRLILATNENDILSRFVLQGDYSKSEVVPTVSPSMDIQLASNFERYLYYLNDADPLKTKSDMEAFTSQGGLTFSSEKLSRIKEDFLSQRVSETETVDTIREFHKKTGYVLDPHTAVGVHAALDKRRKDVPMVSLATAHPGKFGEAVSRAIGKQELPESLKNLAGKQTRCTLLNADLQEIKEFVQKNAIVPRNL